MGSGVEWQSGLVSRNTDSACGQFGINYFFLPFFQRCVVVQEVYPDGLIAQDGRLQPGDQIIEINGINTKNMTHGEAIDLIKSGQGMVRLLVRRGKMPPSALMGKCAL